MNKEYKVGVVSLGCSKNLVDSEIMIGELKRQGFCLTGVADEAEIIIVNTCAFVESATQESIDTILEMAKYKNDGKCRWLIVTGCLAERYKDEIMKEIPEVDGVLGTKSFSSILSCIDALKQKKDATNFEESTIGEALYLGRSLTTGSATAFLKIAEGCDNHCTYCIIPKLRGRYQSRPMDEILHEAEELARRGVRELIVIAQDTSYYGLDLYGKYQLAELLNCLCQIKEIRWIRVHYCYPERITHELIEAFKNPKICPYMDIPIQHANDSILKRMGRGTSKNEIRTVVHALRTEIPNICIRTSIIVGFPGETAEDFEELKDFVKEIRFDRLGVFSFSSEEEAPASRLPNQISQETKEARRDELMRVQHEIAISEAKNHIGETLCVLVEGHDGLLYFGRSARDSVDIDSLVYFASDEKIEFGTFVPVHILTTDEYDLIGEAQK